MPQYLGIDTSNYTTSAAIYDSDTEEVFSQKKLLSVTQGQIGLRQSDAVFSHVKQFPEIIDALFKEKTFSIQGVGVSASPRRLENSYMPAFLVGNCIASSIASCLSISKYECSHQEGHILSALHSAKAMSLLKTDFYAFHVSGGTTECLLIKPDGQLFSVTRIAKTLDLNAGQLVDRVGVLLGLTFPCGMELDKLSLQWPDPVSVHPAFEGLDCHFSGAQNQCEALFKKGMPAAGVARFAIEYVCAAVDGMTARIFQKCGEKPVLYAGGVMSNSVIRQAMTKKYSGHFADPYFSSDNASGPAIFAARMDNEVKDE